MAIPFTRTDSGRHMTSLPGGTPFTETFTMQRSDCVTTTGLVNTAFPSVAGGGASGDGNEIGVEGSSMLCDSDWGAEGWDASESVNAGVEVMLHDGLGT